MALEDRKLQYNAAGEALQAAAEAVQAAETDEALGEARTAFLAAKSEFERCEVNLKATEEAVDIREFRARPVSDPAMLGMDAKEVRTYSMVRAMRAVMNQNWKGAELEREASEAVAQRMGKEPQGFYVPMDIQVQERATMAAGLTVATELLADSFIDMLRKRPAVMRAGATYLGGLVGNIAIPRQTAGATAYWIGENTDITAESHPTIDQVTMTPHALGAYSDLGRQLLLQSSVDVEALVRRDLATTISLAIDLAALSGTGATVYPKGIAAQDNVAVLPGGTNGLAPTWAHMVQMETEVAADNADIDRMAYIVNAKTRGYLKSTPKVATYSATMMWNDSVPNSPVNGYPAIVSNQARSDMTKGTGSNLSELFFGNFADLIIGQWGGLDIIVNPYTGAKQGLVQIVALQDVDVCVRHGESFSRIADAIV